MIMKKSALFLVVLLILSTYVIAEPADVDSAYLWLLSQSNTDVFTASLTALAVSRADPSRTESYLEYLRQKKHATEACWPSPNCNVKDTSLALIVENKLGLGIEGTTAQNIAVWLVQKQTISSLSGEWDLQVITSDTGTCGLTYQKPGQAKSQEFTINVDAGKISYGSCQDEYFFNLNSCLGSNILDKPSTIVEVSCQLLGSSQISVIYRESNTIYLISEPISTRGIFTI